MKTKYLCKVSGQVIPQERVEALRILEVPEDQWTLKEHANVKPRRGIYMGENGTSELKLVQKVGTGTVRDIFLSAESFDEPEVRAVATEDEAKDPDSVSVAEVIPDGED